MAVGDLLPAWMSDKGETCYELLTTEEVLVMINVLLGTREATSPQFQFLLE